MMFPKNITGFTTEFQQNIFSWVFTLISEVVQFNSNVAPSKHYSFAPKRTLFVAGAAFGEVHVSLFVAGAACGEIWDDSRSGKRCNFQ